MTMIRGGGNKVTDEDQVSGGTYKITFNHGRLYPSDNDKITVIYVPKGKSIKMPSSEFPFIYDKNKTDEGFDVSDTIKFREWKGFNTETKDDWFKGDELTPPRDITFTAVYDRRDSW